MPSLNAEDLDLEIETHPRFEKIWRAVQWVVMLFLGAMAIAALAGVFGTGPLARVRQPLTTAGVQLDHPRFARVQSSSQLIIEPTGVRAGQIRVHLDQPLIEKMGIESASPTPLAAASDPSGTTYLFAVAPGGRGKIVFKAMPTRPGIARGVVRVEDEPVSVTQVIWP
jgi:hypothetical protein